MQTRTEDLLTLRDGEPMDARRRAQLLADSTNVVDVARLAATAHQLRQLPEHTPPPDAWNRVAAKVRDGRDPGTRRPRVRVAGTVAALAAVAVAAVTTVAIAPWRGDAPERGVEAVALVGVAADTVEPADSPEFSGDVAYAEVIEQSAALDTLLAALDRRPQLMSAATADTIALLEDHIMAVDSHLSYAAAYDADPVLRYALWRERVDVMTALVHVRYAHAASAISLSPE